MAACESCNRDGYGPEDMKNRNGKTVGPCCDPLTNPQPLRALPTPEQLKPTEPVFGLEISNKVGIRAFLEYGGAKLEFQKTPDELKKLLEQAK